VIQRINPPELVKPSGFTHAVVASGRRRVYLAGQIGVDAAGVVVPGGVVAQFDRALSNLLTALAAAGGTTDDLVQMTIYLTDLPGYQAHASDIRAVWLRHCGPRYPAVSGIGVTRLWLPEALVEISAVAELP
jgi:enamine deaminase RidA (YjgF/YER057c/UK114 family)